MDCTGLKEALPEIKKCIVCKEPSDKSCAACKSVNYCSAEHQRSHWKAHKKVCSPIRLVNSSEYGPHFIATRDIKAGTLIHTEAPTLVSPRDTQDDRFRVCIACCSLFLINGGHSCSKCTFPLCSELCSNAPIHATKECGILAKLAEEDTPVFYDNFMADPIFLLYLRCIDLKLGNPKTWNSLLNLEWADQKRTIASVEAERWIRAVFDMYGLKEYAFPIEILRQRGIFAKNSIPVPSKSEYDPRKYVARVLYVEMYNFVHNCYPNCVKFMSGPNFNLTIRTAVAIKSGEVLTINRDNVQGFIGASIRQHSLPIRDICRCHRCLDPTESGTMQSAIKCLEKSCKIGYLLPQDPMDMREEAIWVCNNTGCKNTTIWSEVDASIYDLDGKIEEFLIKVPHRDAKLLTKFLDELKTKLHPNHFLLLKLLKVLAGKMEEMTILDIHSLSIARLNLQVGMIEDLLKVADVSCPGMSIVRGCILTDLSSALGYKLRRLLNSRKKGKKLDGSGRELAEKQIEVADELIKIMEIYPSYWGEETIENMKEKRGTCRDLLSEGEPRKSRTRNTNI